MILRTRLLSMGWRDLNDFVDFGRKAYRTLLPEPLPYLFTLGTHSNNKWRDGADTWRVPHQRRSTEEGTCASKK